MRNLRSKLKGQRIIEGRGMEEVNEMGMEEKMKGEDKKRIKEEWKK